MEAPTPVANCLISSTKIWETKQILNNPQSISTPDVNAFCYMTPYNFKGTVMLLALHAGTVGIVSADKNSLRTWLAAMVTHSSAGFSHWVEAIWIGSHPVCMFCDFLLINVLLITRNLLLFRNTLPMQGMYAWHPKYRGFKSGFICMFRPQWNL